MYVRGPGVLHKSVRPATVLSSAAVSALGSGRVSWPQKVCKSAVLVAAAAGAHVRAGPPCVEQAHSLHPVHLSARAPRFLCEWHTTQSAPAVLHTCARRHMQDELRGGAAPLGTGSGGASPGVSARWLGGPFVVPAAAPASGRTSSPDASASDIAWGVRVPPASPGGPPAHAGAHMAVSQAMHELRPHVRHTVLHARAGIRPAHVSQRPS